MSTTISHKRHIYTFIYGNHEKDLSKLESRQIFNEEDKDKLLFSNVKVEPLSSKFLKSRFDILLSAETYVELLDKIKKERICIEGFKAEYLVLKGDITSYSERLKKLKDIGYSIEGTPDYYKPTITYSICSYRGIWYFGILTKDTYGWRKHQKKPHSFSNSINQHIAKALVNIATRANKEATLLDACCGVATIMLEACFAGYNIEGCDINWKVCRDARLNLAHFNYSSPVYRADIKHIIQKYDAAILDLPYNLFSYANDSNILHIIESAAQITNRLVIVSNTNIVNHISSVGLKITDSCEVKKTGKAKFTRKVWVCEKDLSVESTK